MPQTRSNDARRKSNSGRGGKGAATQTATRASIPISEADLATYRLVQAQFDAQKKAAKEAEDAGKELLDAEDDPSTDQGGRPRKKRKSATQPVQPVLSEGEDEIASRLQPVNAIDRTLDAEMSHEEDEEPPNAGDDEGLHMDLDGMDVDEVDIDTDSDVLEGNANNEISFVAADIVQSNVDPRSRSRSVAPKTPGRMALGSKKQVMSTLNAANTSKVVEKDFSPRTLKLALASKSHVRTRTVFDEPFPRNNKISRINFAWTTIKESAFASEDVEVRQAFKRATDNINLKSKLMKFTLYGRTGLVSSIISKAREKVRAYYGLSGDPECVKKDVEWLLKSSHFVYGDINLKERTVDKMKPFGAQLIIDIIEAQWFPSTSRSKLDLETTNRIYEKRDLPLNVILLVVTAIEHALKEWSTNGRKATQITFSEDTARLSYERHLRHWKFFESQMKAWPAWWRKTVLEQIL
ncbi:hypothetical protein CVT26_005421 [Gymnopilus dilepis]|uniref:DUF6532 domain-containing protein n=1 Tax=Gymnopilus dilepis TaxID=231916 RepID=A0A409WZ07_9AGAR|nr:hypothetical protein CVT26_005421 [Gymnopilus dilepis]